MKNLIQCTQKYFNTDIDDFKLTQIKQEATIDINGKKLTITTKLKNTMELVKGV